MPILKNKTQNQYLNVDMHIFHDKELKLIDRGLITTLMSLPDNWDFTIKGLEKILPDKKSAISASLLRIEEKGYLTRRQIRTEHGHFGKEELEIHQIPIDKRKSENRVTANRSTEKQTQSNNHLSNNHISEGRHLIQNTLSEQQKIKLLEEFGEENVLYQLKKINTKHYVNCKNYETLRKWCMDYKNKVQKPSVTNRFNDFQKQKYDYDEIEKILVDNYIKEGE